jgi:hypothetical protein
MLFLLLSILACLELVHISHSHKTFRARVWYLNSKPSNQNAILIERSNWIFVEYENKTRTLKFYDVRPVPIRLIQWVKQVTHSIQDNETVITSGQVKTRVWNWSLVSLSYSDMTILLLWLSCMELVICFSRFILECATCFEHFNCLVLTWPLVITVSLSCMECVTCFTHCISLIGTGLTS